MNAQTPTTSSYQAFNNLVAADPPAVPSSHYQGPWPLSYTTLCPMSTDQMAKTDSGILVLTIYSCFRPQLQMLYESSCVREDSSASVNRLPLLVDHRRYPASRKTNSSLACYWQNSPTSCGRVKFVPTYHTKCLVTINCWLVDRSNYV